MRISQAPTVSGASVRALRHYEDEGLITPGRLANGYRDFCPSTVATVLQIRALLDAGLPVRLIRSVLPYLGEVPASLGAASLCDEFLDEVERYRDRLAVQLAGIEAQYSAVNAFLQQARPSSA